MSDLLSDTLRLVLRRLESVEAKLDQALNAPTRTPLAPRAKRSERPENAEAILDESVSRINEYWATHRAPMHFFKFSGAFAKRWFRQTTNAKSLRDALTSDPRLAYVLTEAGGTLFVPRDAFDKASPIDRMEWSRATKSTLREESRSELDAARQFSDVSGINPLSAPDAFGSDPTDLT